MSSPSPEPGTVSVIEGQTVKFIPRDAATEARAIPYYDFYTNLTGTVAKIYPDSTVAVIVDRTTLPEDARLRHEKSEQDMRDKWMRSLSEDDRGKLSDAQKRFSLRYTLLTNASDLIDIKATPPPVIVKPVAVKQESAASETENDEQNSVRLAEGDRLAAEEAQLAEINRRASDG